MGKLIKFPTKEERESLPTGTVGNYWEEEDREADFETKMKRIKASLEKINRLMSDVKEKKDEV